MTKKILTVANDTGVANGLSSSILMFNEDKRLETIVLSEGPSQSVFNSKSIIYKTLDDYGFKEVTEDAIDAIIKKEKPDVIFTGFSEGVMLEKYSINNAKLNNIPSITVLEGYTNYLKIVSDNELKQPFKYMPDFICIMDEFVLEEMLKLNFDKNKLIVTGNPYFDDLAIFRDSFNEESLNKIREELNIDRNGYLIIFFSQAIKKVIDKGSDNMSRGYNELTVLSMLESSLYKLNVDRLNLLIKLHPKEDLESTQTALSGKLSRVIFNNNKNYNPRNMIIVSDLVTGMFSTALIESVYLYKDVLSIQPNIIVEDTLLTNRFGLTIPIYREEDLKSTLEKIIYDQNFKKEQKQKRSKLVLDGKATERVANFVYKSLNIN